MFNLLKFKCYICDSKDVEYNGNQTAKCKKCGTEYMIKNKNIHTNERRLKKE